MSNERQFKNGWSREDLIKSIYSKESLEDEYAADLAFLQKIQNMITINGQLPFQVPIDNIPIVVEQAAEWYFRHCEDAVEIKWLMIDTNDLRRNGNFNLDIRLPHRILSVNQVKGINPNTSFTMMPYSYNLAFRYETMFMTAAAWSNTSVGGYAMNAINKVYSNRFYDNIGDSMIAIQAQGDINSIFSKHYYHSYNRNSRTLRFLSDVPTSNIVLEVYERLCLQDLYDDDRFTRYVVGMCLKNITRILRVFGFKMPGGIEIDPSEYKEWGQELIDEVKEELDADGSSPIIMFS
ncbi:neck protein [Chryseobacterium phage MA9V-2]|nr:neck protein [Chryseobacterium phage MA9V-2]